MLSKAQSQKAGFLLLLAVWFGLLSGIVELMVQVVTRKIIHPNEISLIAFDFFWMIPLAQVILFSLVGLVFFLVALRWPRLVPVRLAVFAFAFLAFANLRFISYKVHQYAWLILAAGFATPVSYLIMKRELSFRKLVRRTTVWIVTIVVVLAVSIHGWKFLEERRAVAKLTPASPNAPNVLLIVLDTVRAKSLSLHGYARPTTPRLERFARTGVCFENTLSTSPWTLPSHASMFTGRFPHELSANWTTPLDATYPTLAELFRDRGYYTAGFVANLEYCITSTGLNRGFIHYEDYPLSMMQIVWSSYLARYIAVKIYEKTVYHGRLVHKNAVKIKKDFLKWLSRKKDQRPFFVFLNYMDAHTPYRPPEPFDTMFGNRKPRSEEPSPQSSPEEVQAQFDAYEGSIAYLDHQLGLLLDELQNRGLLQNTLVIITSDHGEHFGEHGCFIHGNSLYRPLTHVPLLISFPSRVPAGKRVLEPVTLCDLPATVLDLTQLEGGSLFPEKSLARCWSEECNPGGSVTPLLSEVSTPPGTTAKWCPISKGDMQSLLVEGLYYIRSGDGSEEFYDFESDPEEEHDLANSEEGDRALEKFRQSLAEIIDDESY